MSMIRAFPCVALVGFVLVAGACKSDSPADAGKLLVRGTGPEYSEALSIDFGVVAEGMTASTKVALRNTGAQSITLGKPSFESGEHVFSVGVVDGIVLAPGERLDVQLTYEPSESGSHRGQVRLGAHDERAEETAVILQLFGVGQAPTCAVPPTLDFGSVAVGDSWTLTLELANPTDVAVTATVGELQSDDTPSGFTFFEGAPGEVPIPGRGGVSLTFGFTPQEAGAEHRASLVVRPGAHCPETTVELRGTGVEQVLTWSPSPLDFGSIPVGVSSPPRAVTFTNVGNREVLLTQLRFDTTGTGPFQLEEFPEFLPESIRIPARSARTLSFVAKPTGTGYRTGAFSFASNLTSRPSGAVSLRVFGGGPRLQPSPSGAIDFGRVAWLGAAGRSPTHARSVLVTNAGTAPSPGGPEHHLYLKGWEVLPSGGTMDGEFEVQAPSGWNSEVGLAPGESVELRVLFSPAAEGRRTATLALESTDLANPTVTLELEGEAIPAPACHYEVSATALEFGAVQAPQPRDLNVRIRNLGQGADESCVLSNFRIASTPPSDFSLPTIDQEVHWLAPMETIDVPVRLEAKSLLPSPTEISGTLTFDISSGTGVPYQVALNGTLGLDCLEVAPFQLDFATVAPGCRSAERTFRVYNTCSVPVTVDAVSVNTTTPGGAFTVSGPSSLPVVIAPGTTPLTLGVRYEPAAVGEHFGAMELSATVSGQGFKQIVPLNGRADPSGMHSQILARGPAPKGDVLMVVDDYHVTLHKNALANDFGAFVGYALQSKVDWHLGMTAIGAQGGRLETGPTHPQTVISSGQPNRAYLFAQKIGAFPATNGHEESFEPALRALSTPWVISHNSGFLRWDAFLSVLVITDAMEQSPRPFSYYLDRLANVKGLGRINEFSFSAVAPPFPVVPETCVPDGSSAEYPDMVAATGGLHVSWCDPISEGFVARVGRAAFGHRLRFFLASQPDLTKGPLSVEIDGVAAPAGTWSHDPISNAIDFVDPARVPRVDQTVSFHYPTACY